jgi:leader peptidase (prepilin peptidase)/N-methyltransferase
VNLVAITVFAVVAGVAAAALNPFMRAQFENQNRLSRSWLQVPIAVVLGGLAGCAGSLPQQVTFVVLAVASALLIVIDLSEWRLPDVIVLPLYAVLGLGLTIAAWIDQSWPALLRAGIGAVVMFVLFFVMAAFARDLGFGDVKLAGVVGGFLGWFGLAESVAGFFFAWALMALVSVVLLILRRINTKASLPFGPYLIVGAVIGVLVGPTMLPTLA